MKRPIESALQSVASGVVLFEKVLEVELNKILVVSVEFLSTEKSLHHSVLDRQGKTGLSRRTGATGKIGRRSRHNSYKRIDQSSNLGISAQ